MARKYLMRRAKMNFDICKTPDSRQWVFGKIALVFMVSQGTFKETSSETHATHTLKSSDVAPQDETIWKY